VVVANGPQLTRTYYGYGNTGTSKTTLLRLLPTLPLQWAENSGGSARGLLARGGFGVDVAWSETGALVSANITSLLGNEVWVTVGTEPLGKDGAVTNVTGSSIAVDGSGSGRFVLVRTEKGGVYRVSTAGQ
jgi:hypothetical protein